MRLKFLGFLALCGIWAAPLHAEPVTIAAGEWKPFISEDLPGYGPHAKRVSEVFKQAGIEIEYVFVPWTRSYNLTRSGRYAATFSWFKSEDRLREVLYPDVPIDLRQSAVYYNKSRFPDGLDITSLDEMIDSGLRIVGVRSYWYSEPLTKADVLYHETSESSVAWRLLDAGRADLYIEDIAVAEAEIVSEFGEGALSRFASAGIIREAPMYILFTDADPVGRELRDAWDRHAR